MEKATPREPDWKRLERASVARARDHFQNTTPGQRVEEVIELSRELTELARRGRDRR
jgi:hypothetical protein